MAVQDSAGSGGAVVTRGCKPGALAEAEAKSKRLGDEFAALEAFNWK